MKLDILQYNNMMKDNHISIIYRGPMWAEKLDSMAEILQRQFDLHDLPLNKTQSVFSVFVEQVENMMHYSEEKERVDRADNSHLEIAMGTFILGSQNNSYFIQTGNIIKNSCIVLLKNRIDYLNTLDKNEIRQYYKQQIKTDNNNPESRGAGIGLVEIARRATSKIDYEFIPHNNDVSYFTMHVTM